MKNVTRRIRAKFRPRCNGSVIVEFAIVLPILLMLTFGIVQYGIIMNTSNALTQIAREGARYAALNPSNDNTIKARISAICATTAIKYSDIQNSIVITPTAPSSRTSGTIVNVAITYPMSKKVFLPKKFFGATIIGSNMTQSASFLVEGPTTTTG